MSKVVKVVNKKKPVKVIKKVPNLTLKQQAAIDLLMGAKGGTKSAILRQAGYSEKIARNPERVFDSPAVVAAVSPWLQRLKDIRERLLERMEATAGTAKFSDIPRAFEVISTQIALLEGTPTANINVNMPLDEQERIKRILNL